MNAVTSVVRIARKARRMVLAWGLVAAAAPIAATAQSNVVPPGPDETVEQASFDFISDGPARRYASSATTSAWENSDEGAAGFGLGANIGQIVGDTIGRNESITTFELMPYVISDDQMAFGSFRMFRAANAELGGSAGLGYRFFMEDWNKIFGFSTWYDKDNHRGVAFEQVSMGLELLGDSWDVRANWYIPNGILTQELGTTVVPDSQRFAGNNLLFTQQTEVAAAANGVDLMITAPIPGEWAEAHDLEASAGFYHFYSRDVDTNNIWGWRLRADGGLWDDLLHMYAEVNGDDQTNTALIFGVSLDWHGGLDTVRRRGRSQKNRLGEFVRRNNHIVTLTQPVVATDTVALNPTDGAAYQIVHVDRARAEGTAFDPLSTTLPLGGGPAGGTGTFEDPFTSIETAFASNPNLDIVYVAGGSANVYTDADFTGPLVIGANQQLLGEASGVDHLINVVGITDPVTLPTPTVDRLGPLDPPLLRPVLRGLNGNAVAMSNGSVLGGFVIDGRDITTPTTINTADGVNFTSVESGAMNDVTILDVSDNGIELTDASGTFVFQNVQIGELEGGVIPGTGARGAANSGLFVQRGNATINYIGSTAPTVPAGNLIANSNGLAVEIVNTVGGNVGLSTVNIIGNGGDGILVQSIGGRATFGPATLTNTTGSAVRIFDTPGAVDLLGDMNIINPGDDAFVIHNLFANGQVNGGLASSLDITSNNQAVGIQLSRIAGTVSMNGTTSIDGVFTVFGGDPAVNFQNSSGQVTFGDLTISNWSGPGINIGDNNPLIEGAFDPTGAISPGSINEDLDFNETNAQTAAFTVTGTTSITNTGLFAAGGNIQVLNDFGSTRFQGPVNIDDRFSVGILVDNMEANSRVSFGAVEIDDDGAGTENLAVAVTNNNAPVSFTSLEVRDFVSFENTNPIEFSEYVILIENNNRLAETDPLSTAAVSIGQLNLLDIDLVTINQSTITDPFGAPVPDTALVVLNNDSIDIGGGIIEVVNGRAITAVNNLNTLEADGFGERFMRFERIDAEPGGGDVAVLLRNNRGDFTVTGINDIAGSGGQIDLSVTVGQNAYDILDQDGDISISNQEINNAFSTAILVNNSQPDEALDVRAPIVPGSTILLAQDDFDDFNNAQTRVNLDNVSIQGSFSTFSFNGINIDTFTLTDSQIDTTFGTGINLIVNNLNPNDLVYDYTFTNSIIEQGGVALEPPLINIVAQAGNDDETTLNLILDSNRLDGDGIDAAALNVDWDGFVNASVINNVIDVGSIFFGTTTAGAALNFEVGDDTNVANILIQSNVINQAEGQLGAISVEADSEVNLTIDNNVFTIDDIVAQGIILDLGVPGTDVEITNNIFNFVDDGGTAVVIDTLVGPSSFEFDNNVVTFSNFFNNFGFNETVLEFQSVSGAININGDNNTINNTDAFTIFFTPAGTGAFSGTIELNGTNFN